MPYTTALSFDLSPVRLSYVAALRGVLPKKPTEAVRYAQTGSYDPVSLMCLAASNPQGQFFGVSGDVSTATQAAMTAQARKVANISFVPNNEDLPDSLDYLCCESTNTVPTQGERDALFSLAEKKLKTGGTLGYRYKAYNNTDDILRFLVAEYAGDLSGVQTLEFMDEIKALGADYFNDHPIASAALTKAMTAKDASSFFEACSADKTFSGTFETMAGLLPRQFSFVGDADIGANYLELSAPPSAHETLAKCREHLLYEPIKDFVLQRLIRNDIWVKRPVEQTADLADLFGHFTFGITTLRDRVPLNVATRAGSISLSTPLFARLIELMCTLPTGIGDFLAHPAGHGMDPAEVVAAIHVLVACGIAQPMRARYEGKINADTAKPVWATPFNAYLTDITIGDPSVRLASPIVGGAVTLSARDALVLQAIERVGLPNSAGSLQPELKKLIDKNPALAAQIMESTDASDEVVHNMITNVVTNGLVRWYAYGLLAA